MQAGQNRARSVGLADQHRQVLQPSVERAEGDDARVLRARQRNPRLAHRAQTPRRRALVLEHVSGIGEQHVVAPGPGVEILGVGIPDGRGHGGGQQTRRLRQLDGRAVAAERRRLGDGERERGRHRQAGEGIGQFVDDLRRKPVLGRQGHHSQTARGETQHGRAPGGDDESRIGAADGRQFGHALGRDGFRRQHQRSGASAAADHHVPASPQVGNRPVHREQGQGFARGGDEMRTVVQDPDSLLAFAARRR